MAAEFALRRNPWNKGKIVGQKAPFKLKEIWSIRIRLQLAERRRELALFNLGMPRDSKQATNSVGTSHATVAACSAKYHFRSTALS